MKPIDETLNEFFKINDPVARGKLLRYFWIISLSMLVLGYILIVFVLFR